MIRSAEVNLKLANRLRRFPTIESTLVQGGVFAGDTLSIHDSYNHAFLIFK